MLLSIWQSMTVHDMWYIQSNGRSSKVIDIIIILSKFQYHLIIRSVFEGCFWSYRYNYRAFEM